MQYRILGGLGVEVDGRALDIGGPKQQAVLAGLLVEHGRSVSVDRLADMVWGDDGPGSPEASLQAYVSNLRRVLEPDRRPREPARVLVTRPAGYSLVVDRQDLDATRFEDRCGDGHRALVGGDASTAATVLDRALEEWTGPPLPELAGTPWVDLEHARLSEVFAQAVEDRIEAGLLLGDHRTMVPRIEQAVAQRPYSERLRAQLAIALYRSGRQREALAALAAARRVLAEEVGIEPGPELRRLEGEILAQSDDLELGPARPAPPAPSRSVEGDDEPPASPVAVPPPGPPLPTMATPTDQPFVGRSAELDAILDAAARVRAGQGGRPVVVSGEPGIGKTRLVEEAAACLTDLVRAWANCPESAGSAPFWAVAQIGRQLDGAGILDAELLAAILGDVDGADPAATGANRLGFQRDVAELLAASSTPMMLVVDDLQWCDPASLRVIEYIGGELRRMPVLLVVTVRPVTSDAPAALVDCLGELAREPGAVRLDLSGLRPEAVVDWIDRRAGHPVEQEVAEAVHARTGGNPFFVGEVLALLDAEERPVGMEPFRRPRVVPPAVHDVVRRRVSRLPAASQRLLISASVIGHVFDVDVLAAVSDTTPIDVLELIEPAWEAGLVADAGSPGRYQFSHALVGETLEAELSAPRRARLHAAIATALASLRASTVEEHLADLAHHAFEGAAAGTAAAAHEWAVRAARQATVRGAPEDAAMHWDQALRTLDLARPGDLDARFDALLALGRARIVADQLQPAFVALVAAIELAERLGDPGRMLRAAMACHVGGFWQAGEIGLTDVDILAALERVVAGLPPDAAHERALLLGMICELAYWRWPVEQLDAVSAEAVRVARASGEPLTLARTLHKRNEALWRAGWLEARAEGADEMFGIVVQHDDPELLATAHVSRAGVSWERGDVASAEHHASTARSIAGGIASLALTSQCDYFLGAIELHHGHLARADELMEAAHAIYRRTRRWEADAIHVGNRLQVWLEQDRQDVVDAHAPALLDTPYSPWFTEGLAYTRCEQGRLDEAAELVSGGMPPLVDSWMYLGIATIAAHNRVSLGDVEAAVELRDELAPFAGRLAACGTGPATGDVHLALARVARLVGDDDGARHHVDASVDLLSRSGGAPFLVRALLLRAELGGPGADVDLGRAAQLIDRFGLALLRRRLPDA